MEGELFPGIPNEVTLDHIVTKLSWNTVRSLSSVSRAWQQAIHNRQVYDARVHLNSTEPVLVVNHFHSRHTNGIALYSLRDRAFFHLPPIPLADGGIPWSCRCIALDGRVYILGGTKHRSPQFGIDKVFVLDLAGQMQWKECAAMSEPRVYFGSGVMNGKIYAIHGTSKNGTSEVYDPDADAWSAIESMASLGFVSEVANVGEELFAWSYYHSGAYHPVKNEWRTLLPDGFWRSSFMSCRPEGNLFVEEGKFHCLSRDAIDVYDIETMSWSRLHSSSFPDTRDVLVINHVLAVDDELVAMVILNDRADESNRRCLFQTCRFNSEDKVIVWQKAECPPSFEEYLNPSFMCALHL